MSPSGLSVAVIVGGAVGNWQERAEAIALLASLDVRVVSVAVNDAGTEHPDPLDHWMSLHPQKFAAWEQARADAGLGDGYVKWSMPRFRSVARQRQGAERRVPHGVDRIIDYRWRDASSGVSAVELALLKLGVPAILCGVPMDDSVNVYRGRPWSQCKRHLSGYQKAVPHFYGLVRSMSGRTRADLGSPDAEWVAYIMGHRQQLVPSHDGGDP